MTFNGSFPDQPQFLTRAPARGALRERRSCPQSVEPKSEGRISMLQEGIASVGGVKLFYRMGGVGTPIIVLHGGPGMDHESLLPQCERLADRNRVVFYDQRACGKSTGYPY